jgi:two-component system OmpR family sensor kinase
MSFTDRARAAIWRVPVGLQLSALYTLLLVTILALLGWGLYAQLDQFLVQNTADRVERAAKSVIGRVPSYEHGEGRGRGGRSDPTISTVGFLVRELSAPDVAVAVLDRQGTVLSATQAFNDAQPLSLLPQTWLGQFASNGSAKDPRPAAAQWIERVAGGGRQLLVVQPISVARAFGTPQEPLLLVQAASLDGADAILNQLRLYLILGLIIGTALGVAVGLGLTRAVLQPLDRMARTAEAIAGGDLTRRLRMPTGGNEVARLGGAFDHMVERLAASLEAQRRFVADASHELRTPLTSLEGLSEMLLMGADRGDSRIIQRMARAMHSELGRMGRLVSDLLTLSRLDSATTMSFTRVEAGKLLEDVAEQVAPVAEARQIRLDVRHDGPLLVRADPDRLKQVILNLVDNALRYTPSGGTVGLAAGHDPGAGMARIQVRDTGPGIAPDQLPHIFDRFYRGDPSRARASGNTGLGLAIAHSIIDAHGGTIEVQSAPSEGARFTIVLPVDRSGSPPPGAAGKAPPTA